MRALEQKDISVYSPAASPIQLAMAPRAAVLLLAVAVATTAWAPASAQTRLGKLVVNGVVPCNTGTLIDVATSPAFPG